MTLTSTFDLDLDLNSNGSGRTLKKLFIGALTKEKEEEEKKKDKLYKLNKVMAITIGLIGLDLQ